MKKIFVVVLWSFVLSIESYAVEMKFSDFSDTSLLTLNGSAQALSTNDGMVLRLTPAESWQGGSFFSTTPLNASNFSSFFKFRITLPGGITDNSGESGADGLVFVVQSVSSSIGNTGGYLGYSGITKSIGIEFDTFWNSWDPDTNHAAIDTAGSVNHKADFSDTVNISTKFDNGEIWYSWADYDGTTLELRISQDQSRPSEPTLSMNINIPEILEVNTAYVGFTSGTGSAWANHDILYWEYRDSYNPVIPCDITDSDGDGVIDQWDSCPDTPTKSWVNKDGCPVIKGDFDADGKLGLSDGIGIIQTLAGIRTE